MKKKLSPQTGILCISTTLNNTFVNLTDMDGNTLYVASSGSLGFKGSKKSFKLCCTSYHRKSITILCEPFSKESCH
jgi:small subunit ribosomal protein S11